MHRIILLLIPAVGAALRAAKSNADPAVPASADLAAASAQAIVNAAEASTAPPAASWPVTLDLPPESVTMKSWNVLKGSMDNLGEQVQQVLLVKTDMNSLQTDLQTQQGLWQKAEQELKSENAELLRKVEEMKQQVEAGKAVTDELAEIQRQVEEAKHNHSDLKHLFDDEDKQHMLEMGFLHNRTEDLKAQHAAANRTAEMEVAKAHDAQLHVQGDYQALRLKAAELQDRLRDGQKGLPLQQEQNAAKTRDLGRQLAEMQAGLKHMTAQLLPEGKLQKEISSLKHDIDAETAKIIKLTEEQALDANNCEVEKKKHESILEAEKAKFDTQDKETTELCDAVNARKTVLSEMMRKCEAGERLESPPPGRGPAL